MLFEMFRIPLRELLPCFMECFIKMDLNEIFTHTIASRAMRKDFAKLLTSFEIIYGEFEILFLLLSNNALNPTEITYTLNCQPAATSRIIKSLHHREFIEYENKVDDRRQVLVSLSKQGKFLIETIKESVSKP